MGGKRMSRDEKRKVVLNIYETTKTVYTENEIIKAAAKEGVNQQTIADINNSLVDDGIIEKEKIGTTNFFWHFPAKKQRKLEIKLQETQEAIGTFQTKVEDAKARLSDARRGRDDDDGERGKKLRQLEEKTKQKKTLQAKLDSLKEFDPQNIADLEQELKYVTEAAHRWTDNIFEAHSYLVKKKGMEKKRANQLLGISDDFDYPEDKLPK